MPEFDWVTALSECSLTKAFVRLRMGIERDIEIRNQLRKAAEPFKFELSSDGAMFCVSRESSGTPSFVIFRLSAKEISITDSSDRILALARLSLNEAGECRFRVKDVDLEEWQLRRRALESLFFMF